MKFYSKVLSEQPHHLILVKQASEIVDVSADLTEIEGQCCDLSLFDYRFDEPRSVGSQLMRTEVMVEIAVIHEMQLEIDSSERLD